MDAQTEQLWQQAATVRVDATGRCLDASAEALDRESVEARRLTGEIEVLRATHERPFKRARG